MRLFVRGRASSVFNAGLFAKRLFHDTHHNTTTKAVYLPVWRPVILTPVQTHFLPALHTDPFFVRLTEFLIT